MNIRDVYTNYSIPPNLQRHMLLVAQIAGSLISNWTQDFDNKDDLLLACLLHDLGNLIKSDLDKYPDFLGVPMTEIPTWKAKQRLMIDKYGSDEHKATKKMLEELHCKSEIISLILDKTFANAISIRDGDNWSLKLLLYCDMRVGPHGLLPLEQRVIELMTKSKKYTRREDLLTAIIEIEQKLKDKTKTILSEITSKSFTIVDKTLLDIHII